MFSKSKITDPIDPRSAPNGAQPAQANGAASGQPVNQAIAQPRTANARPSVISADLKVVGSLVTSGDVEIEGSVEGDVHANVLTIGETASILGEVMANDLTVRGRVKGRIRGARVHLMETARVEGDILHKTIAIDPGAQFQGSMSMSDNPLKVENGPMNNGRPGIAAPAPAQPGMQNQAMPQRTANVMNGAAGQKP